MCSMRGAVGRELTVPLDPAPVSSSIAYRLGSPSPAAPRRARRSSRDAAMRRWLIASRRSSSRRSQSWWQSRPSACRSTPRRGATGSAQSRANALGRQVTLEGPLELVLGLRTRLSIGGVRIANPPGFATPAFAELGAAHAEVDLRPLLRGRLRIRTLDAANVKVWLERAADGRRNWVFEALSQRDRAGRGRLGRRGAHRPDEPARPRGRVPRRRAHPLLRPRHARRRGRVVAADQGHRARSRGKAIPVRPDARRRSRGACSTGATSPGRSPSTSSSPVRGCTRAARRTRAPARPSSSSGSARRTSHRSSGSRRRGCRRSA